VDWKRDLLVSYNKVGDLQQPGDLAATLAFYRKTLVISETLAGRDPGNVQWQRDLIVSLIKVSTMSGEKSYLQRALNLALTLKNSGRLAPVDDWMIDDLRKMIAK
jgi:hypothetical protein